MSIRPSGWLVFYRYSDGCCLLKSNRPAKRATRSKAVLVWLFVGLLLLTGNHAHAQRDVSREKSKNKKPDLLDAELPFHVQHDDEFISPSGDIRPGAGRTVLLADPNGKPVVGRIYIEGNNRYVVLMPNGTLVSVTKREAAITDRPFKVQSQQDIQKSLLRGAFKGFNIKRTKHYLYVYKCSAKYATATSRILETMYPRVLNVFKKLDLDIHEPEFPLVVLIFGDRKSFEKFKHIPNAAAYYSPTMNYIVMHEDPDLTATAPQWALKHSIGTIAHEGMHQILFNIGVQQRLSRWPYWISEGLPEYCAPTETGKRIRWRGLGLVHNTRMWELLDQRKDAKTETDWLPLKKTVEAEKGLSLHGYATAWATVYAMAKSRKTKDKFAACLKELSQMGPLEKSPEPGYYFRKYFGDNYRANRKHIVAELNKAKKNYVDPIENQTYFVCVIEVGKGYSYIFSSSLKRIRDWKKSKDNEGFVGKTRVNAFATRSQAKAAVEQYKKSREKD